MENASGLGTEADKYNTTTFNEVKASRLRLEIDSDGTDGNGILQWKVLIRARRPISPPIVTAGEDRSVVVGGKTYLSGTAKDEGKPAPLKLAWLKDPAPAP